MALGFVAALVACARTGLDPYESRSLPRRWDRDGGNGRLVVATAAGCVGGGHGPGRTARRAARRRFAGSYGAASRSERARPLRTGTGELQRPRRRLQRSGGRSSRRAVRGRRLPLLRRWTAERVPAKLRSLCSGERSHLSEQLLHLLGRAGMRRRRSGLRAVPGGSPAAALRRIARSKHASPELEQCCIDDGYCCLDEHDLDHDGNRREMLGACDGVRCP